MVEKIRIHGTIAEHIERITIQIAFFLESVLPSLYDDWWNKAVVNTLSVQQKRRLEHRNITSLGGLDLAGLLRVLDQNWYQISNSLYLTSEARHFAKEMQTVRNRWAHADTEEFPVADIYQDLDTLQRFAVVIGAEEKLIKDLGEAKATLLAAESQSPSDGGAGNSSTPPEQKKDEAEFEPGQIVFIKSNPSSRGAVVTVLPGKPENRFKVFLDSEPQTFYASQLQAEDQREVREDALPCDLCKTARMRPLFLAVVACVSIVAGEAPDLATVPADLAVPALTEGNPAPGQRVKQTLPEFAGTEVYHTLYLPREWKPEERYPILVDYPGNGPYSNEYGDVSTGRPEGLSFGYGASGGQGFIWMCMPFIDETRNGLQLSWWGDLEATIRYCREAIEAVCEAYGGDPNAVFLAGFSRGAIACNYLGLHDDAIADLWLGFIPYSHYDGLREDWGYPGADRASASERFSRIKGRASFVSSELEPPNSIEDTRCYVENQGFDFPFSFAIIPFRNHNDAWTLRDIPERRRLREWLAMVLRDRPGTRILRGSVTDAAGAGVAGVRISSGTHWVLTDHGGHYALPGLIDGDRLITAAKQGWCFQPGSVPIVLTGETPDEIDFVASATHSRNAMAPDARGIVGETPITRGVDDVSTNS